MILDPINRPVEDTIPIDDAKPLRAKQAQEARQAARKLTAEEARQRELNDLAAVLDTDAGRALVLRVLKHCQPYRPTVISTDVEQYLVAEGRRGVAHWLIHEMGALGPEVYPNLLVHNARLALKAGEVEAGIEAAERRKN